MSSSSTPTTSPSRLLYGAEDALGIARDHLGVEQRRHLRGVHGPAAHHDAQQPRRVRLDVENADVKSMEKMMENQWKPWDLGHVFRNCCEHDDKLWWTM